VTEPAISNEDAPSAAAVAAVKEKPNPHAEQIIKLSKAMLRATLLWGGVTAVIAAVVFGVLFGAHGIFGSLVGSAVAFASAFATILMMRKTANLPPSFVMVAALGGYTGKLIVVFLVLTVLRGVDVLHPKALAFTMLAAIMVAAIAEFRAFKNAKIPTLIVS
jgi:F0F1-type ATP synthase assembly protein I